MSNNIYKIFIAVFVIFILVLSFLAIRLERKNSFIYSQESYILKLEKELEYYKNLDTTYLAKKDSIEYNIIRKDSTITKIIEKYENEKEYNFSASDDVVIDKFYELVWSN